MGLAIVKFILPAVTSLSFLAPSLLATRKRLYSEAFIFGFTTFFQIFHHLCTTPGLSLLFCLLGDKLLEYFATYGVVLSTYVTLIQLSKLSETRRHNLCTSGSLLTAVRAFQSTESKGLFLAPIVFALLLLATSWGQRMWESKSLFPEKDKWIKLLIPGFALGAISLTLRLEVENSWNFMFVHSVHHLLLGVSLTFLLQFAEDGEKIDTKFLKCGCTAACCVC